MVRATVGVFWKGEKRLVVSTKELDVVGAFDWDSARNEPEGVTVGENGKIWMMGKVVGGVCVSGEPGCVELQVKNHSNKKVSLVVVIIFMICELILDRTHPFSLPSLAT
jgi:hypothetical protein